MLFEAGGYCPGMLDLVKEPLDQVSVTVKPRAEGRYVYTVRHGLDVCPRTSDGHGTTQGITVIGTVGEQDLARADGVQHVGRTASVMRLALGQFERDGIAVGINDGVDFRGEPASRAPHAPGRSEVPIGGWRRTPFLTLAAC